MANKRLLVGVGCMLVAAVLVIIGVAQVPTVSKVLILMGGALGFVGYRIYELRRGGKPNDMNFG